MGQNPCPRQRFWHLYSLRRRDAYFPFLFLIITTIAAATAAAAAVDVIRSQLTDEETKMAVGPSAPPMIPMLTVHSSSDEFFGRATDFISIIPAFSQQEKA
jgi:hypothetical protein